MIDRNWASRPAAGALFGEQKTGQRVQVTGLWRCRCGSVSRYEQHETFHACRDCGTAFRRLIARL